MANYTAKYRQNTHKIWSDGPNRVMFYPLWTVKATTGNVTQFKPYLLSIVLNKVGHGSFTCSFNAVFHVWTLVKIRQMSTEWAAGQKKSNVLQEQTVTYFNTYLSAYNNCLGPIRHSEWSITKRYIVFKVPSCFYDGLGFIFKYKFPLSDVALCCWLC